MKDILRKVASGEMSLEEADTLIRGRMVEISGIASLDVDRENRTGIPEVIIAEGKSPDQLAAIVREMVKCNGWALVSRIGEDRSDEVSGWGHPVDHNTVGRTCVVRPDGLPEPRGGRVGILTAGTSDIPVAEEARVTAEVLGCQVRTAYDIGVAGIHRMAPVIRRMAEWKADVLIVAAGREGALSTLVSALVDIPVIGLPISTGYGHGGNGETALSAMLQSCSPLVVVNIDAGFVAGAAAARFARRMTLYTTRRGATNAPD